MPRLSMALCRNFVQSHRVLAIVLAVEETSLFAQLSCIEAAETTAWAEEGLLLCTAFLNFRNGQAEIA